MKQAMIVAASLALAANADMSPQKLALFEAKGVNVDRIRRQNKKHASKGMVAMHKARATSHYLKQESEEDEQTTGNDAADAAIAAIQSRAAYYEGVGLGLIDGFTSPYNQECSSALTGFVTSTFDVLNNINFYRPDELAKFNLANINLTEASNGVFAYCDITHLTEQATTLTDYENPDQYIVLASRVAGVFASDYASLSECIKNGKERQIGYDVGSCTGELASLFLDTKL